MMQRHQSDYAGLLCQNQTLKQRLLKLSQIQSYIDVLVQNNKNYQQQISILQGQSRKLRHLMQQAVAQRLHAESAHQHQTSILKKAHNKEITSLVSELKDILREREEAELKNRSLVDEMQRGFKNDMQDRLKQMEELDQQYQVRISKLRDVTKEQAKEIEALAREAKQSKIWHMEEVEALTTQNRQLGQQCDIFTSQLNKVDKQYEKLTREYKDISIHSQTLQTRLLTTQQQKNDTILQLKQQIKSLTTQLQRSTLALGSLQSMHSVASETLTNLQLQNQQLKVQLNEVSSQNRRALHIAQESQHMLKGTQEKLRKAQERGDKDGSRNREIIRELQGINQELKRKVQQEAKEIQIKIGEIRDLLDTIAKLEGRLLTVEKQCARLLQLTADLNDRLHLAQSELQNNQLQLRSLRQKLALYQSHNNTLQQMLQKQKRRTSHLQSDKYNATKVVNCQRSISQKYEAQIKKVFEQFYREKGIIIQQSNQEREKLKAFYQYTLVNKEELFNRKLELLEREIQELRGYL